jgi:hypothetical protein
MSLQIYSDCRNAIVTAPSGFGPVSYYVDYIIPSAIMTITFPPFTKDRSIEECGDFKYTVVELFSGTLPLMFTYPDNKLTVLTLQPTT